MANFIEGNKISGNGKGGIYNAGKNTKIVGNNFIDQDRGIVNTGENMHVEGNIFSLSNTTRAETFWTKWWMKYIIYPIMVGIILTYFF